jgi:hypothetical protein
VPSSVPISISVPNSQKNQTNPIWNDLTSNSIGKKFHLAQVAQDGSGVGSFLSGIPMPVKQQQGQTSVNNAFVPVQQGLPIANQAITTDDQPLSEQFDQSTQVPLVQVRDWSTDASEGDHFNSASGSPSTVTNDTNDQSISSSVGNAGEPEVALRPAIGTMSLAASMKHAVTLQVSEVKPTLVGARIKLLLKNNSGKEVVIPENQKVAYQKGEDPEQLLAIEFTAHHVPAGGSACGIVKFPNHQVDPDTDLYLPHFLKDGSKFSDLHATADD